MTTRRAVIGLAVLVLVLVLAMLDVRDWIQRGWSVPEHRLHELGQTLYVCVCVCVCVCECVCECVCVCVCV